LHVLREPELKSWDVTLHIVVGQACGSKVEEMATLSLCIAPNCTLKSVLWESFGFPGNEVGPVADRNVAIVESVRWRCCSRTMQQTFSPTWNAITKDVPSLISQQEYICQAIEAEYPS